MKETTQKKSSKLKFLRSLQSRIIILVLCVGMVPMIFMQRAIIDSYVQKEVEMKIQDMQNQMNILANHLVTYNYLADVKSEVINAELEQLSTLFDGRVLIINKNFKIVKDTYGAQQNNYIVTNKVIKCFEGNTISEYDEDNAYIEMVTPIYASVELDKTEDGEAPQEVVGVILISFSTGSIVAAEDYIIGQASILGMIHFIMIVAVAIVVSKVLLVPLERVRQAIQQVQDGVADEVVHTPGYVEADDIVEAFNQVLAHNKILDNSRQEFVSNVSHELKTPITSIKVLAESLIAQEDVPNELYREFMEDIAQEIEREDKIINDLLSLVKLDKTTADLNVEPVFLNQMLELILKRLRPIAQQQDIALVLESMREVTAEIDEVKMTLAISNFVENAIKYNKKHGHVTVELDADYQFAQISIRDTGIGIPKDSLDHIYERFYRVDKSHSREIGGTGLGLAIARNAVLMHRGSIKVESEEGIGTTFIVRIPLSYIV